MQHKIIDEITRLKKHYIGQPTHRTAFDVVIEELKNKENPAPTASAREPNSLIEQAMRLRREDLNCLLIPKEPILSREAWESGNFASEMESLSIAPSHNEKSLILKRLLSQHPDKVKELLQK